MKVGDYVKYIGENNENNRVIIYGIIKESCQDDEKWLVTVDMICCHDWQYPTAIAPKADWEPATRPDHISEIIKEAASYYDAITQTL